MIPHAYSSYSDSGVEWLGEVPSHWQRKPLLAIASECNHANIGMQEDNLLSLSYGSIIPKDINSNDGLLPASFETYQIVEPNDIVWRLTDLQNDKRSLRTAIVRERGIITSAYLATRPRDINADFINYLLRAYDLTKVFYSMGGGLRQSMKFSDVKWLPVMVPPDAEQSAIVSFLDREVRKIDELLFEQHRLVELMKEKRRTIIFEAVSKGLNPDVPMKRSGMDWLGDVPEHWEVRRLSQLFRAGKGKNGALLTKEFCADNEGEYPVYSGQTENEGVMGTWNQFEFDFGDKGVLFSTTVGAKAMHLRQLFGRFSLSQNCMIIWATSERCIARFFYYHFQPLFFYQRAMIPEHMQPSFRVEDLYSYTIALPPHEEQVAIVAFLDAQVDRLDALGAEVQRAIDLLQERRNALISAAVTGQIDVREPSEVRAA